MPCHIKREYAVQVFQVDELMIICKGCLGSNAYNLADLQRIGRIQACKKIEQEFVVRLQKVVQNFPMALCWQIFYAGPAVRNLMKLFEKKSAESDKPAESAVSAERA